MAEIQKPNRQAGDSNLKKGVQDFDPNLPIRQNTQQNTGFSVSPLKGEAPTAYDIKLLQDRLSDFSDEELKRIPIVPQGCRLKRGATYIDLLAQNCQEFVAFGDMEAGREHCYVSKVDVSPDLWRKLLAKEG